MNTPARVVCNRCTYDLTGHASDGPITCPECGQTDAARVETYSTAENDAVVIRAGFAIVSGVGSFMFFFASAESKFLGALACVLLGFAIAGAISARRRARGANTFFANVVFILVGVYTVLCFVMAIGERWG